MKMRMFDFAQKNILITGAARGIGKEAALLLAAKQAQVYVLDIDADLLAAMQQEQPQLHYRQADVADAAALQAICAQIGRVDVLINNAGIQRASSFMETELESWRRIIDVNLTGTFICTQAALPYMGPHSTILNVLTHEGRRTNHYPYAASKAAIKNLTQNLALELAERQISINGIAFGAVYSVRNAAWQDDPQELAKALARTPLHFMLQPAEVAHQIVTFLENSALYATGSVFDVSGGRSLR